MVLGSSVVYLLVSKRQRPMQRILYLTILQSLFLLELWVCLVIWYWRLSSVNCHIIRLLRILRFLQSIAPRRWTCRYMTKTRTRYIGSIKRWLIRPSAYKCPATTSKQNTFFTNGQMARPSILIWLSVKQTASDHAVRIAGCFRYRYWRISSVSCCSSFTRRLVMSLEVSSAALYSLR